MQVNEYVDNNAMIAVEKFSSNDLRMFVNLYKHYKLMNSKFNFGEITLQDDNMVNISSLLSNDVNLKKKLKLLENKVYTVNGRCIPNNERVSLELKNIVKTLEKQKISENIKNDVVNIELKQLQLLISDNKLNNEEILEFCKKKIVVMQATLGKNITFFNEGLIVFFEILNNK